MKNILIIGDSYSTYEGCIPDGYRTYYSPNGREEGPVVTKMRKEDTWWMRVLSAVNGRLALNNSWSGSTVCYTAYDGVDCSQTNSFIYRFRQLQAQGFFKKTAVDTVFIFGGTNDSWSNAPLGENQLANATEKDLYCVLPAINHLIGVVKNQLPNAEIYCIINTEIKSEIQKHIEFSAQKYGVHAVVLHDIEKEYGHPNPKGMKQIAEQVLAVMKRVEGK